jgi:hypothetical protein
LIIQAYIRIQSLINLGRTSPVPSPSPDLSTSILRIVCVPYDEKSIIGNFAVRSFLRITPELGINAKDNLYPQDLSRAKHFCKSYFDTSLEVSIKVWISR